MRKILIFLLLVIVSLGAGCPARKPAPAPEPKPLVVPETSKVGFSPVDLSKAPDVVKNIASEISKRETATWVQVNGNSYVLVSVGEKAAGNKAEITDVTQRVPAQDFVWLDVKARYVGVKEGEKAVTVTVVALNPPDRTINGVGFEVTRTAAPAPAAPSPAPAAPAPAVPAPAPKPAPAPSPTPAPAPRKAAPEAPAKKEQPPASGQERELKP